MKDLRRERSRCVHFGTSVPFLNKGCILLLSLLFLASAGCAPALIGAGATGTYKVATDERTTGKMWDDSTLTIKIKTALIENSEVSAGKIDVDVYKGVVTLTGAVSSQSEKEKITGIASKTEGIRRLIDNITVK